MADVDGKNFGEDGRADESVRKDIVKAVEKKSLLPLSQEKSNRRHYIEIDDLLGYLEAHPTFSGIQRAQAGVIEFVVSGEVENSDSYIFVMNPVAEQALFEVDRYSLLEIVEYVADQADHAILRQMISALRDNSVRISVSPNDQYYVLGAFWGYGGVASRYFHLKHAGVIIGLWIYDLIPINNREYCDDGLPHEFSLSFADAMSIFDFFATISEFTAVEVRKYREKHGLPPVPVEAVPLAHSPHVGVYKPEEPVWTSRIKHLRNKRFALMVSTIEARKNHSYLVAAWKHFWDEGLEPPDLVFVGRVGWRVSSLMEQLQTARYYDGRVSIVHDLSDIELRTLYNACEFTLFPSFVEGWGLPVGESLMFGKPCVASSTSSIPEVGGDFVDYIDPLNLRDGTEILRRMTFDDEYREARTNNIRENFIPRTWREVAGDLIGKMGRMAMDANVITNPEVYFPSGKIFEIGRLALGNKLPDDYPLSPMRLMLTGSWYGIENFGCWMKGDSGSLTFRSDLADGTEVIVYLRLAGAPWASAENILVVEIEGKDGIVYPTIPGSVKHPKDGTFLARTKGQVGEDGIVKIILRVSGVIPFEWDENSRRFAVGISAIGYAGFDDIQTKMDVSEDILYGYI
ncbi:MAG: glycosyltransferase family 1 protein [bacterium]|nr:glycosyltransferase family 1 protein [bacterium]